MSNKSNEFGRAFEYACITSLYESIKERRVVHIIKDTAYNNTKAEWDKLPNANKKSIKTGAQSIVETIFDLEPMVLDSQDDVLTLKIQADKNGEVGDVRDLLIVRSSKSWEIGLSLKHNHFAVKHSRLSRHIDFGEKWYGIKCSDEYWNKINPIFDTLELYRKQGKNWNEITDKAQSVYLPILAAFKDELETVQKNATISGKLVEYLLGKFDFYKVVSLDNKRETQIFSYNLHGTLNKNVKNKTPKITIPRVFLPDRIASIEMKPNSDNTLEVYLNNGWQFSFRIHNASTKVEASLKFDIQIVGMPTSINVLVCKWNCR